MWNKGGQCHKISREGWAEIREVGVLVWQEQPKRAVRNAQNGTGDRGLWQVSTSNQNAKFLFKSGMRRGDPSAWLRSKLKNDKSNRAV